MTSDEFASAVAAVTASDLDDATKSKIVTALALAFNAGSVAAALQSAPAPTGPNVVQPGSAASGTTNFAGIVSATSGTIKVPSGAMLPPPNPNETLEAYWVRTCVLDGGNVSAMGAAFMGGQISQTAADMKLDLANPANWPAIVDAYNNPVPNPAMAAIDAQQQAAGDAANAGKGAYNYNSLTPQEKAYLSIATLNSYPAAVAVLSNDAVGVRAAVNDMVNQNFTESAPPNALALYGAQIDPVFKAAVDAQVAAANARRS